MAEISGAVEDSNGNPVDGATLVCIRESDDTVVGVTTSDSVGEYEFTGLDSSETFHVGCRWNDGSTDYNSESLPFIEPIISTGPIDDFNDGDIVEYSGDKLSFEVQTNDVYEGSHALEMNNDAGSLKEIISTSGLVRYPNAGDTFSFRVKFDGSDTEAAMTFGVQDTDNKYRARIITQVDEISLQKVEGGSRTRLDGEFASIPTGEWLLGTILWDSDSNIQFRLEDASGNVVGQTDSIEDSTFTSGGIGWQAFSDSFSGQSVKFDIATLTERVQIVDTYEDGDISEYDQYNVANAGVTQTTVNSGTYSAFVTNSLSGDSSIISTSGLENYPAPGDIFEAYIRGEEGTQNNPAFNWGVEFSSPDSEKWTVQYRDEQDDITLFSNSGIGSKILYDLENGKWYRFLIEWLTNGGVQVRVFDPVTDAERVSVGNWNDELAKGGIGIDPSDFGGKESTTFADDIKITGSVDFDTIYWATQTDWNNAVSSSNVETANGEISLAGEVQDLTNYEVVNPDGAIQVDGQNQLSYTDLDRNDADRVYRQKLNENDQSLISTGTTELRFNFSNSKFVDFPGVRLGFSDTTDTGGNIIGLFIGAESGDHDISLLGDASLTELLGNISLDTTYYLTLTYDAGAGEVTATVYSDSGRTNQLGQATETYDTTVGWDYLMAARGDSASFSNPGALSGVHNDYRLGDTPTSGSLTTATKSFDSPTKPNLTHLGFSEAQGGISVDVIGSPGTADEEIVSQTLGQQSLYDLSWSNSHTDFRVQINITRTDNLSISPAVNAVQLREP